MVDAACKKNQPYATAFVDMRMPPGWNGIETIGQIWMADPRVQVVICTAYSDDSWDRILRQLGRTDRLLILKKPFDADEARQLALTLTTKWNLARGVESMVADLEKRVSERTAELLEAKETAEAARALAEAANRAKSEFLATMSHELRTPLNGVTGMIQLLHDTPLGPTQREYLSRAKTASESLLKMVNDILDFSRMEGGKVELAAVAFDVRSHIKQVVDSFAQAAAQKELDLGCIVEPNVVDRVVGDAGRLGQVVQNLLSNAVKFTESGRIVVRVSKQLATDEFTAVLVKVTDTGVGIPKDKLDIIFKSFSQVDSSSTRKYGGAGLGLAICHRIIEAMGGRIGVESAIGQGTTMWFTVPLLRDGTAKAATGAAEQAEAEELAPPGTRILVAEDSEVIQFFTSNVLARQHYELDVVANGKLALEALSKRQYQLILMDCDMPEMDGLEATRRIRDMEHRAGDGRHIPIIALTAEGISGDRSKCMQAGMDDFLTKPIEPGVLLSKIRRLIARPVTPGNSAVSMMRLLQTSADDLAPAAGGDADSPAIDSHALLKQCQNDLELATGALDIFGRRSAVDLVALEKAIQSGRGQETSSLAHGLKGIARHLGANRLSEIASRIEKLGSDAEERTVEQSLRELRAELERCVAFIPQARGELNEKRTRQASSQSK
jgi:signal transduction histidine kinase/HPt (histidine-containing phosphotransfer) domain-containing protein